mmetsp:Transcript_22221/g.61750  ORF Transcript_22221/g.61750 Transcript_22221/m.61750 type:complete len:110 (+) Transcript_22221:1790-2119(+)
MNHGFGNPDHGDQQKKLKDRCHPFQSLNFDPTPTVPPFLFLAKKYSSADLFRVSPAINLTLLHHEPMSKSGSSLRHQPTTTVRVHRKRLEGVTATHSLLSIYDECLSIP